MTVPRLDLMRGARGQAVDESHGSRGAVHSLKNVLKTLWLEFSIFQVEAASDILMGGDGHKLA